MAIETSGLLRIVGRLRLVPVAALALTVLLASCSSTLMSGGSTIAPDGTPQAIPAGTDPEDAVIGLREHPRIVAAYGGEYNNRKSELMVERIVSRLLQAANQPQNAFTVTILDSAQVNAFALPGGYIYVTRGILALANDSSELAAVLAHEIAHVTLRHARARSNRQRTSELVDQVITGVFGGDAETDQSAARSRMSLAAFTQSQELEADEEGVMIAGRAGYDPHAAGRFLAAMARFAEFASGLEEQSDDFLSSHPSTPNRIQRAVETARSFGAPGIGETDRAGYLNAIEGLSFGDSPAQGVIIGQRFVHPGLRFTFAVPGHYVLQNTTTAVVGVAGDGEAVRFDSADVPSSMDLETYLKSGWIAGLDPASVTSDRHNGVDMASGTAQTPEWHFRVTALRFDGEVYRFIFASRTESRAFVGAAAQTIQSFRRATRNDIQAVSEQQVELITARAGDTVDTLAARMSGVTNARQLFLILNNLFAGDPVQAGEQYKIVVAD